MSKTTGPVLALGAVTIVNKTVFNEEPMDWRVVVATGLLAVGFNLVERLASDAAEVLAWTALLASLVTRLDPAVPSPVESALRWWDAGKSSRGNGGSAPSGPGSMEV